jgi:hypothetical protein
MAGRVTASRVLVGRDVNVVRELTDGVDLAGRVRLRPGHLVDVTYPPEAHGPRVSRRALVWSWAIVALSSPGAVGNPGPLYRGICRWDELAGKSLPR